MVVIKLSETYLLRQQMIKFTEIIVAVHYHDTFSAPLCFLLSTLPFSTKLLQSGGWMEGGEESGLSCHSLVLLKQTFMPSQDLSL